MATKSKVRNAGKSKPARARKGRAYSGERIPF